MRYLLIFLLTLALHAIETPQRMSFEWSFSGLPILKASLTAKNGSNKSVRMLLDTGTSTTVLDRSVSSAFVSTAGPETTARTSFGGELNVEPIIIHKLELAGISVEELTGLRSDLSLFNRTEDLPIDGIIGIDVIKKFKFILDLKNREIIWGGNPNGFYLQKVAYTETGTPTVTLTISNKKITALVDTGDNGALELTEDDYAHFKSNADMISDGTQVDATRLSKESIVHVSPRAVNLGGKSWCNIYIVSRPGLVLSRLGIGAMWDSIWFDFQNNQIGLAIGSSGCFNSHGPIRMPIHAFWDRTGSMPKLVVVGVKPNSYYEKIGLKSGDTLLGVGEIGGEELSLVNLEKTLRGEPRVNIKIERNGKIIQLQ
ncbi:MAG: aspartyl protease family protein [Geothrix sp.]|nr:aspartyl protease family protein [Geothrix sp.]